MTNFIKNNIFRFLGDFLIVTSRAILLRKIKSTKSVSGISLQTQFIYLIVYLYRYLDLISVGLPINRFLSFYNFVMKLIFIGYQLYIIYNITFVYSNTYEKSYDNFNLPFLFIVAHVVSIFIKGETHGFIACCEEYLYTTSLILEAVAILPQLVMNQESGDCEKYTAYYVFCLGLYRVNYFVHFFIKYMSGRGLDSIIVLTSVIQTVLYVEFFITFYKHIVNKKENLM